jgi:hypothetical protein
LLTNLEIIEHKDIGEREPMERTNNEMHKKDERGRKTDRQKERKKERKKKGKKCEKLLFRRSSHSLFFETKNASHFLT